MDLSHEPKRGNDGWCSRAEAERVSERMQPRPVKAKEYCWHTGIERKRDTIIRVIYL